MQKCNFNQVALQLYRNHTSAWVFSCKFAAYFQDTSYMNTSGGLTLSCRNQSIDLLCKSMDWFLYDKNLRHERVNLAYY